MSEVNWYKPLVLSIILAVVGGFAYWHEYSHQPKKESAEKASKKPFEIKEATISEISISRENQKLTFECIEQDKLCKPEDRSSWKITSPKSFLADSTEINSLLNSIERLSAEEILGLHEESSEKKETLLKEYGLSDEVRAQRKLNSIQVKTKSGQVTTLYFGNPHPIGDKIFALREIDQKVEKDNVFLISSPIKTNFTHPLSHWRDKSLFSADSSEILQFNVRHEKKILSGTRNKDTWELQGSSKNSIPGDKEEIQSFLNSILSLKARGFVSDSLKDKEAKSVLASSKKLIQAQLVLEKEGDKKKREHLKLVLYQRNTKGDGEKIYASVSNLDPLYEMNRTVKDRFKKELKDLRLNRLLSSGNRFDLKKMEFSGSPLGKEKITLSLKDLKWQHEEKNRAIDESKVRKLLNELTAKKIKDYVSTMTPPQNRLQLDLEMGKEREPLKFQFWKKGKNFYAKELGSKNQTFKVDNSLEKALPWSSGFFDKKKDK